MDNGDEGMCWLIVCEIRIRKVEILKAGYGNALVGENRGVDEGDCWCAG